MNEVVTVGDNVSDVGGLVGYNIGNLSSDTVTGTSSINAGSGAANVGGLVGYNNGQISNGASYQSIIVGANSGELGAIAGNNDSSGTISKRCSVDLFWPLPIQ